MNSIDKLRPSIFLTAAILLHDYSLNGRDGMGGSPYCCDCIEEAISEADKDGDELEFFEDMFKPESPKNGLFGWWEVGRVFSGYGGTTMSPVFSLFSFAPNFFAASLGPYKLNQ